jgi:hypothetical protein
MRHTLATISAAFVSLMLAALGVWPASALAAAPIVTPVVTGCSHGVFVCELTAPV